MIRKLIGAFVIILFVLGAVSIALADSDPTPADPPARPVEVVFSLAPWRAGAAQ